MSPLPERPKVSGPPVAVPERTPSLPVPPPAPFSQADGGEVSKSVTILSELDSYIAERMKGQPTRVEEAVAKVESLSDRPRHRLQLPDFFEALSADNKAKAGPYIFRWTLKKKQAIDRDLNRGWILTNRSYFPSAPRYLFTANGGIEVGDALLMFMPARKALLLREAPARISQERLRGQMTHTSPDYVLMSGDKHNEHIYQPQLGPEAAETAETPVPGVLTAGRDF